jgi:hypothetical protein
MPCVPMWRSCSFMPPFIASHACRAIPLSEQSCDVPSEGCSCVRLTVLEGVDLTHEARPPRSHVLLAADGTAVLSTSERSRWWLTVGQAAAKTAEFLQLVPREDLESHMKMYQPLIGALVARHLTLRLCICEGFCRLRNVILISRDNPPLGADYKHAGAW